MTERRPAGSQRRGRLGPEQARAIAECIADGQPHTVIAERYGVSVETVGAIKSGSRWADALDDDVRSRMSTSRAHAVLNAVSARRVMCALESGRSGRAIAEEFGISESMVSAIKHGLAWASLDPDLPARLTQKPRQGKALAESQVADIKRLLLKGMSTRKVAAEFGVSASAVQAIAQGRTWSTVEASEEPAELDR